MTVATYLGEHPQGFLLLAIVSLAAALCWRAIANAGPAPTTRTARTPAAPSVRSNRSPMDVASDFHTDLDAAAADPDVVAWEQEMSQ